ncbi:MAG: monovalent cation/H(+) antiporter subunit G [Chloroflexota bacterium]
MTILELVTLLLAVIGVLFMNISAIGMMRLPDVYARMHAAGKAATLGVSCLLLAAGIFYGGGFLLRMVLLIILFFITAPIATTAMARAAHRSTPEDRFVLKKDALASYYRGKEQDTR